MKEFAILFTKNVLKRLVKQNEWFFFHPTILGEVIQKTLHPSRLMYSSIFLGTSSIDINSNTCTFQNIHHHHMDLGDFKMT